MGTLAPVAPQAVSSIPKVLTEYSLQATNSSECGRVAIPKRLLKVGNKSPRLVCKGKTCSTKSFSCTLSNGRGLTRVNDGIPGLTRRQKLVPTRHPFPASGSREDIVRAAGRDASTADESKAADGIPSLEEMLIPLTNFATTSESRIFTITVHGVTTEDDVKRLNLNLSNVDGLVNAWVGPLKEGGLRGGSVPMQVDVDSGVPLRSVTKAIQSLDKSLLVLPYKTNSWSWRGNKINYAVAGCGKPIVLVHGFGGNAGHYASLISYLAEQNRVYAVDLLGFGASDKPVDANYGPDLWGELVRDFTQEFAEEGAILVGNSIGSLAVLSAAAMLDDKAVSGVVLLNCAGAMNRKGLEKDDALLRAISPIFIAVEYLLQRPKIANYLFNRFRSKKNVKTILSEQAYHNKEAVTDQLVDILHHPSEDPGALEVFVKVFINEPGPRPETLMPQINVPLLLLWGDKDRWTPANGKVANYFRKLGEERGTVFVEVLPDVGHCPHDDRPELVAERMFSFVESLGQS
ncbi:unnamed protein product [Calypogeia fissa]